VKSTERGKDGITGALRGGGEWRRLEKPLEEERITQTGTQVNMNARIAQQFGEIAMFPQHFWISICVSRINQHRSAWTAPRVLPLLRVSASRSAPAEMLLVATREPCRCVSGRAYVILCNGPYGSRALDSNQSLNPKAEAMSIGPVKSCRRWM